MDSADFLNCILVIRDLFLLPVCYLLRMLFLCAKECYSYVQKIAIPLYKRLLFLRSKRKLSLCTWDSLLRINWQM